MLAEKVEVGDAALAGLAQGQGGGGHRRFKTKAEEHHFTFGVLLRQLQGVHRRIDDADVGAARFRLQQGAVFSRHAHGVAKGAENHPRTAGDIDTGVDASHRQHAHRAAGAVNKLDIFRQQLVEAEFKNGVGMAAAHFHNAQRTVGGMRQQARPLPEMLHQLHHLFRRAVFIDITHLPLLAVQQRADVRLDFKHILQRFEGVAGFGFVDYAHGETHVDQHPLAETRLTAVVDRAD